LTISFFFFPPVSTRSGTNPGYDSLPPSSQPEGWSENLTRSKSKKKKKSRAIHELEQQELDAARRLSVLSITAMLDKSSKNKVTEIVKTFQLMVGKKEEKVETNNVFEVDLSDVVERTGVPSKWTTGVIPKCLFKMFEALDREGEPLLSFLFNGRMACSYFHRR